MSTHLSMATERLQVLTESVKMGNFRLSDSELCEFARILEEEAEVLQLLGEANDT